MQLKAQNQFPSQERVETLLEFLNECKKNKVETETHIKFMEERPLDYSLQKYLEAKEQLEGLEVCITRSRKLLDAIRKDHPDWFNSPSATMTLDRGREITPNELEDIYRTTLERFTALAKRYKALDEPED